MGQFWRAGGKVPHVSHSPLENAALCTNGSNAKAAARHRTHRLAAALGRKPTLPLAGCRGSYALLFSCRRVLSKLERKSKVQTLRMLVRFLPIQTPLLWQPGRAEAVSDALDICRVSVGKSAGVSPD
jgi:hypothetical protein